MKIFQTDYSRQLVKSLHIAEKTQEAISDNIENIDNPSYIRRDTSFYDELNAVQNRGLHTTREKHISTTKMAGSINNNTKKKVDLTREMSAMAVNQIKYNFSIQSLKRMYAGLKSSITGRIQ